MDRNRAGTRREHVNHVLESPSRQGMGMKPPLCSLSHGREMLTPPPLLTHSVCRRETKVHSEPQGPKAWHSWHSEFCAAAGALIVVS